MKQAQRTGTVQHHALGHAVVQQGANLRQLRLGQTGPAEQTGLKGDAVFHAALHPLDGQAAVVGNVGGFGGPGRHRAKAGRHHDQGAIYRAGVGLAVGEQSSQLLLEHQRRLTLGRHQVNKTGRDAIDLVVNSLQGWQELLNTKAAESAAALELGNVQGHFGGLNEVLTGLKTGSRSRR